MDVFWTSFTFIIVVRSLHTEINLTPGDFKDNLVHSHTSVILNVGQPEVNRRVRRGLLGIGESPEPPGRLERVSQLKCLSG